MAAAKAWTSLKTGLGSPLPSRVVGEKSSHGRVPDSSLRSCGFTLPNPGSHARPWFHGVGGVDSWPSVRAWGSPQNYGSTSRPKYTGESPSFSTRALSARFSHGAVLPEEATARTDLGLFVRILLMNSVQGCKKIRTKSQWQKSETTEALECVREMHGFQHDRPGASGLVFSLLPAPHFASRKARRSPKIILDVLCSAGRAQHAQLRPRSAGSAPVKPEEAE